MPALESLRVVVTRAAHQAEPLAALLRKRGAEPILLPMIAIGPPQDPEALRRAAAESNQYDWVLFTSANAVAAFSAALPHLVQRCTARIACIGTATRDAAQSQGYVVDVMPERYIAESLVSALTAGEISGRNILIPSAAVTRDIVAVRLREHGAKVTVVEAYRNIIPPQAADQALGVFQKPYPEWVTFASSSAVDNLVSFVGTEPLRRIKIASIGAITSATVYKHGLTVAAEASVQTIEGLVEAICRALK